MWAKNEGASTEAGEHFTMDHVCVLYIQPLGGISANTTQTRKH